ncbi:hypothetical protein MUP79_03605, partial [Candidatus Bathyarchaeota archaeon]|nr:hypothetical protein [Candidatus Bathyarchaeota archaeon]
DPNGTEDAEANLWVIYTRKGTGYAEYAVTYYDVPAAQSRGTVPRTGNGTLATLTMNATASGVTGIHFIPGETSIGDASAIPLATVMDDGTVTVIPALPGDMTLYVDPPESIFYSNVTPVGSLFQINVSIMNASDVGGIQFKLTWNSSVLTCLSIVRPAGHFMDPNGTEEAEGNLWVIYTRKGTGYAEYVVTYYDMSAARSRGTVPRTGNGVLAVLTMNLSAAAPAQTALAFDVGETFIASPYGNPLSCALQDGMVYYELVGPRIEYVTRRPNVPNYDEAVEVASLITGEFAIDRALLYYTNNGWVTSNHVTMHNIGDIYFATIPANSYGTTVQYNVFANDTNGNYATSDTFSYTVVDRTPPAISSEWKPTCPSPYVYSNETRAGEPTLITASVSEPAGASGVSLVLLSYKAGAEWWNTTMTFNSTLNLWTTEIPGQTHNVEFFITAYDNAGNLGVSSTQSYEVKQLLSGDINADFRVNILDAILLSNHWGQSLP